MRDQSRSFFAFLLLSAFTMVCTAGAAAQGKETKIQQKDIPAPVMAAFTKAYPAAKITGSAKEDENGAIFYEIESMDGKTRRDILYSPDGKTAEIEEMIASSALPGEVKSSIEKGYHKSVIDKAEKVIRGEQVTYEVHLTVGKKKMDVALSPSGKILLGKEAKEEKEDEEEEEDD